MYSPIGAGSERFAPSFLLSQRVLVQGRSGDVTILLPSRRGTAASMTLLAHAPGGEDGFALLTVAPPAVRESRRTPRDFTFVVDVSGSMSGRKLVQAKAAGRQVLGTLRPDDRFRIVDFSSDARTFRDAFVAATPANIREAARYIERLEAEGGTNISGALEDALRDSPARGRLGVVLFLTDHVAAAIGLALFGGLVIGNVDNLDQHRRVFRRLNRPRSRRLGADIEDVGAFSHQLAGAVDGATTNGSLWASWPSGAD